MSSIFPWFYKVRYKSELFVLLYGPPTIIMTVLCNSWMSVQYQRHVHQDFDSCILPPHILSIASRSSPDLGWNILHCPRLYDYYYRHAGLDGPPSWRRRVGVDGQCQTDGRRIQTTRLYARHLQCSLRLLWLDYSNWYCLPFEHENAEEDWCGVYFSVWFRVSHRTPSRHQYLSQGLLTPHHQVAWLLYRWYNFPLLCYGPYYRR